MNQRGISTIAGILYILFGVLCIVLRGGILMFAAYFVGAVLVVYGIIYLVNRVMPQGIVLLVLGVVLILTGWFAVTVLLYIFAIVLIVVGIVNLYQFYKTKAVNDSPISAEGLRPILIMVCGILLLLNPRGTVSVLFVIVGVLLIVNGIMALIENRS